MLKTILKKLFSWTFAAKNNTQFESKICEKKRPTQQPSNHCIFGTAYPIFTS